MGKNEEAKEIAFSGIYGEIARILGEESAVKIYDNFRGQQISFPMHLYTSEYVAQIAIDPTNDFDIKYLARKYHYSERHLARVVKKMLEKNRYV